jgi:hypothetical protein
MVLTHAGKLDAERGVVLQPRHASHLLQHCRRADLLRQPQLQWYLLHPCLGFGIDE